MFIKSNSNQRRMPEKYTILSDLHTGGLWRIILYLMGEIEEGNKILIPGIDSDRVDNLDILRYLQEYHFRNVFMTAGNHEEGFVKTMYEFYNFNAFSKVEYSSPMIQLDMSNTDWLKFYFSEDNASILVIFSRVNFSTGKKKIYSEPINKPMLSKSLGQPTLS